MSLIDWQALGYLLLVIIIGYAPYKLRQRFHKDGLNSLSPLGSFAQALWFIVLSAVLFVASGAIPVAVTGMPLLVFIVTTIIWFVIPFVVRKIGVYPQKLIAKRPGTFVIRLEPRTFYPKFFEVLFQQAKFLYILGVVFAGLAADIKIFWFIVLIGFLHLNNVFFLPKGEGWVFFYVSFPAAYLFSILILGGNLLLAASLHLGFYIVIGIIPWFHKKYAAV